MKYHPRIIPSFNKDRNTKIAIKVKHDYFENSFFTSAISEWNKLDFNIRNSASPSTFKKKFLNIIKPCAN